MMKVSRKGMKYDENNRASQVREDAKKDLKKMRELFEKKETDKKSKKK